jgi:hypothetical protein
MAAKKTTASKPETTAEDFKFEVGVSEETIKVNREKKPNPLLDHVRKSLTEKVTLQVSNLPTPEKVHEVALMLQRAARELKCGLSLREHDTYVVFKAKPETRKMKYTANDIRTWAVANGVSTQDKMTPRIPAEVRDAFRKAHGYAKDETKAAK